MILFLSYLILGAFSGVIAGLFGLGGGVVIVPAMVLALQAQGVDEALIMNMAIATSLATIVMTSLSSIYAHHHRGAIRWDIFVFVAPGILIGSALGVEAAVALDGVYLKRIFGGFLLLVAFITAFNILPKSGRDLPGRSGLIVVGGIVGWCSALLGIGGGTLTVPFFTWCRLRMQQAIALSAACGFPIALMASIVNVAEGWELTGLPPMSAGYVYLPAMMAIVLTSMPCARFGAKLAHRLSADRLRQGFALVLFLFGLKFIT